MARWLLLRWWMVERIVEMGLEEERPRDSRMDLTQTEAACYRAIVAEVRADLERWPLPLQDVAFPLFDRLVKVEFSRVAALPPFWLRDRLQVAPSVGHWLGVAHLYGWWFYCAQDDLLDGDAPPARKARLLVLPASQRKSIWMD